MFEDRYKQVKSLMKKEGFDCLLLSPGPNLRYLSGFHFDFPGDYWDAIITWDMITMEIIPIDGEPLILAPKSSDNWVKGISKFGNVRYYSGAKDQIAVLKDSLGKVRGTLGIEDQLPFKILEQVSASVPRVKIKNASDMLSELRLVKSKDEIECIRRAARIVERGVEVGRECIQESTTERGIALEVEKAMREKGAEVVSYCFVQAGAKTATWDPPSEDRVKGGDFILMDLSATYNGYHADITRMTVVGKPSEKQKRVYAIVQEAQLKAIDAVRDGVKGGAVNDAAKRVIDEGGYGKYCPFGVGHGLGLETHEPPHLTEYKDMEMELRPGIVLTIEPTINLPGEFGIRIEDDVLVARGGRERLTTIGRELVQI